MPAIAADSIRYHRLPLAGVDAMRAHTSRAFPRHTHDQYGIGLVDAGGHSSWSGRGQVEAGPDTFISVNPGEVHDGHAVGGVARAWRIVYFEPVVLAALRADVLEDAGGEFEFNAPVFADTSLRAAFESAYDCTALPVSNDGQRACEIALLELIARLGGHAARRVRVPVTTPDVHRARARIEADPAAPHTLVELASEAGVSRFQLIRGFRRALGLSPHAYVIQQRLALARRLIRRGEALADVALTAGFCDQSHMARCFTRQFGVPPRRYALLS